MTVTSPLSVSILPEASVSVGAAALEAGVRKHRANDPKCSELGWVCVPLTVETYGNWGKEAQATFSRLASCIATTSSCQVLGEMYGRLNFTLVQAISRAILGRCLPIKDNVELQSVVKLYCTCIHVLLCVHCNNVFMCCICIIILDLNNNNK